MLVSVTTIADLMGTNIEPDAEVLVMANGTLWYFMTDVRSARDELGAMLDREDLEEVCAVLDRQIDIRGVDGAVHAVGAWRGNMRAWPYAERLCGRTQMGLYTTSSGTETLKLTVGVMILATGLSERPRKPEFRLELMQFLASFAEVKCSGKTVLSVLDDKERTKVHCQLPLVSLLWRDPRFWNAKIYRESDKVERLRGLAGGDVKSPPGGKDVQALLQVIRERVKRKDVRVKWVYETLRALHAAASLLTGATVFDPRESGPASFSGYSSLHARMGCLEQLVPCSKIGYQRPNEWRETPCCRLL